MAALVRLLAPLGIAAPAVRTAVSRMVRQGWLEPVALPAGPGYRLTPHGATRMNRAAERVYRVGLPSWDGSWHLLVLDRVPGRAARQRLRSGLAYLGYAPLADNTWIAPRSSPELDLLLAAERVGALRFTTTDAGAEPAALVRRAWDLEALAAAYQHWLETAHGIVAALPEGAGDRDRFAVRSALVHEWRKFLFTDPGLPHRLLPEGWPGVRAAEYFAVEAERLRPAAVRFVDSCLDIRPAP